VSRKTGRSSVAAAAYRSAEKLRSDYDGITHDYKPRETDSIAAAAYRSGMKLESEKAGVTYDFTHKRGVIHAEIILPATAPRSFADRATLWNAVEKSEKRHDAQTARDIDVALPVEFSRDEQIAIIRDYARDNFVNQGMCADFAIHDKGDGNPHAHILLTTRRVTENGFGNKNREWNDRKYLCYWREKWADICNERLSAKGLDERIDHRTLKAQGIRQSN
jgi:ATP-dependent exoDNAse (exonuclease V) alpha subunit